MRTPCTNRHASEAACICGGLYQCPEAGPATNLQHQLPVVQPACICLEACVVAGARVVAAAVEPQRLMLHNVYGLGPYIRAMRMGLL